MRDVFPRKAEADGCTRCAGGSGRYKGGSNYNWRWGLKPEEKKRGSVCIATQKRHVRKSHLSSVRFMRCTFGGPLFPRFPFRSCHHLPTGYSRFPSSHSSFPFAISLDDSPSARAPPRINVSPMNPLINLTEPLLPPSVRSKEAKSSDKGKMAASGSSVDEFIRLGEHGERKSGNDFGRSDVETRRWR